MSTEMGLLLKFTTLKLNQKDSDFEMVYLKEGACFTSIQKSIFS